jgi:hypothetical protein
MRAVRALETLAESRCERRAHRTRQRLALGHLAAVLLRAELKAEFEAEIMMTLRNEFLQGPARCGTRRQAAQVGTAARTDRVTP